MAIKPVDFQVMIPKMSEVSKINDDVQQKGLVMQQQDNIKLREEINNNLKQVYNKEEVQYGRIGDKQEKDLSEKNKKKNNKQSKNNSTQETQSRIDIKI